MRTEMKSFNLGTHTAWFAWMNVLVAAYGLAALLLKVKYGAASFRSDWLFAVLITYCGANGGLKLWKRYRN